MNSKVTVYIPNHNYEFYFKEAIESVINQTYKNWELILIIDGYNKISIEIGKKYVREYKNKIKLFINKNKIGLRGCANLALRKSKGVFFTRLDADDLFVKTAFKDFINFFKINKKINLVYSDYYYVDNYSNVIDKNSNDNILKKKSLLNLPAHGACSFIRTKKLKAIGGYNTSFDAQDGYELWLNLLHSNSIGNIQKPLFFYRQHEKSMSKNENRILEAKRKIKRLYTSKNKLLKNQKILIILGARNNHNILFKKINKKFLIDYSLNSIKKLKNISKVFITTDDQKVLNFNLKKYKFDGYKRPNNLSMDFVTTDNVIFDSLKFLKKTQNFNPDIVVFINSNTPCLRTEDIQEALDTLVIFKSDSVISVYEDFDLHYKHNTKGLKKISERMHSQLRVHRDALFVDNRSIIASIRKVIKKDNMLGKKIGHSLMRRIDSINIKNDYDLWLADKFLKERKKFENI
jgi:CMP-N-acetylneuraminic acid synthetase